MKKIEGNPVFYFSGTGGCLAMAKRVCERLPEFSPVPIAALDAEEAVSADAKAVGLVFPLYFAGLPNIVERFVRKLELSKDCYIFAIVTCGHAWSGYAFHQLKGLLRKKKQKLFAGFYIEMVDNYLPHFYMPSMEEQEAFCKAAESRLEGILDIIKDRKTQVQRETAMWLYPSHWIFAPRFKNYDRSYTAGESCNSCGICEKVCPVNNIDMIEGKTDWKHKCEFCLGCIQYCPKEAIQWKKISQDRGRYHYKGISAAEVSRQKEYKGQD